MTKERRYSAVLAGLVLIFVSGLRIFGQGGEGGGREARAENALTKGVVDERVLYRVSPDGKTLVWTTFNSGGDSGHVVWDRIPMSAVDR